MMRLYPDNSGAIWSSDRPTNLRYAASLIELNAKWGISVQTTVYHLRLAGYSDRNIRDAFEQADHLDDWTRFTRTSIF